MITCPNCGTANPEGARFCMNCAQPLAPVEATREARKVVTVVFADVTGSTGLGERLDPESLRAILGRWFDAMRDVLERHGGTVEKFIGDAIVAVFGVPTLHEDDALRAVRAATEMRAALVAFNEALRTERGLEIEMRVGVNTGEVVVGDARAGGSRATGDAVNVAARLQQAAEPGETLLGDSTWRLVREAITTGEARVVEVRAGTSPSRSGDSSTSIRWRRPSTAASAARWWDGNASSGPCEPPTSEPRSNGAACSSPSSGPPAWARAA